jgi:hypothetical protein
MVLNNLKFLFWWRLMNMLEVKGLRGYKVIKLRGYGVKDEKMN